MYDKSFHMAMHLSYHAGVMGYTPIYAAYGRTDVTRQGLCEVFLEKSDRLDDTLVLLDVDHEHPTRIVELLTKNDVPVVVPLMFRRQEPYQCCAFRRDGDGQLHHLATFPPGLHRMDAVGSGAVAIQRRALEAFQAAGHKWFFKYEYLDDYAPSEDMYFSKICEASGVEMYVDTTIETPHIGLATVDRDVHDAYLADHPELVEGQAMVEQGKNGKHPITLPLMVTRI